MTPAAPQPAAAPVAPPALGNPTKPVAASQVAELVAELAAITTRPWTLMEVCGGQTHAILRWGLDQLLPPGLRLLHGPGCPVCVTPAETIDQALALARRPEVILCSYGDMLRVPGSAASADGGLGLLGARAGGGDVRLLTSPLQALDLARAEPRRQVVFLAVGFETTAPATALLAQQARALGLANLSLLVAHARVVPAMEAILAGVDGPPIPGCGAPQPFQPGLAPVAAGRPGPGSWAQPQSHPPGSQSPESRSPQSQLRSPFEAAPPAPIPSQVPGVQGFLAAGHVAAVLGTGELADLVRRRQRPVVVTGFEPAELLAGILRCVQLLEAGTPRLANAYGRVVRPGGNRAARALLEQVFVPVSMPWRGLGPIGGGGLALAPAYAQLDARRRFGLASPWTDPPPGPARAPHGSAPCQPGREPAPPAAPTAAPPVPPAPPADPCISGAILLGRAIPPDCPAFGGACSPERPLGAPMVSSEGACAAYHRYRRPARGESSGGGLPQQPGFAADRAALPGSPGGAEQAGGAEVSASPLPELVPHG